MICNKWDVVVVPFPFVDSKKIKPRPALVLSNKEFNANNNHAIMAMITTGRNTSWYKDFIIKDLDPTGLKVNSLIRGKIFTLDNRLISKKIGKLSTRDTKLYKEIFEEILF